VFKNSNYVISSIAAAILLSACGGGSDSKSKKVTPAIIVEENTTKVEEPVFVNTKPIAKTSANQNVTTNSLVTLDASSSSDIDNDPTTYQWSIVSKPDTSDVLLSKKKILPIQLLHLI
jgi:hypothetical protein